MNNLCLQSVQVFSNFWESDSIYRDISQEQILGLQTSGGSYSGPAMFLACSIFSWNSYRIFNRIYSKIREKEIYVSANPKFRHHRRKHSNKIVKIKTPTHSFSILDVVLRQDKRREATSSIYIFFTITGPENYRVSIN